MCFSHLLALKAFGTPGSMRSTGVNGVTGTICVICTFGTSVANYANVSYGANGVADMGAFVCWRL